MKKFILSISSILLTAACIHAQDMVLTPEMQQMIADACPPAPAVKIDKPRKILFFTKTAGFRHTEGIPAGKYAFQNMADKLGLFDIVFSEDTADIEPDKLKQYDAIVMFSTTGNIFGNDSDRILKGIMDYVENGGGLLSVHAGVDCYNYDPFRRTDYTSMLGGEFIDHPWNYGERSMMVIDDTESPITKGIWNGDGFGSTDEIYMLGKTYDRDTCRVLVRVDRDKSPAKPHANPKRDVATVLVKKHGKGRIAYDAYCHGWQSLTKPQMQELAMRLAQYVCGDLKVDTTSLPFVDKMGSNSNAYIKPTTDLIQSLSTITYGGHDEEINTIMFGVCGWNNNEAFCKEIESFILSELKKGSGTDVYQGLLAEMLWAVKISSKSNCNAFEKIMGKKGLDEGVRGRLSNAIAHFKEGSKVPYTKEAEYKIPSKLPEGDCDLARLFSFLAYNPEVKLPSYLNDISKLSESNRARLIFTLGQRGQDLSQALSITPESYETTLALAYAAAKMNSPETVESVLKGAKFIGGLQERQIIASYLTSIHSEKLIDVLLKAMQSAKGKESELLIDVLSRLDLDSMVGQIFKGFDEMQPAQKIAILRTSDSIDSPAIFDAVLGFYLKETDKKVKAAMIRSLLKNAQANFTDEMFDKIIAAYAKVGEEDKVQLLNFAQFASNDKALNFCKQAFKDGMRDPAIKAMGKWRSVSSLPALVAIAKASSNAREKQIVQIEILNVGDRIGWDSATTEYMLKNAMRPEDKDKSVEIAAKSPSKKGIELLRAMGKNSEADKAQDILENAKPKGFTQDGASNMEGAFDNNVGSRWSNGRGISKDMFIAFDFGFPKEATNIKIDLGTSGNDFPDSFYVEIGGSLDTAKPVDFDWSREGNVITINFGKLVAANVYKIVSAVDKGGSWWSVHEVQFDTSKVKPLPLKPQKFYTQNGEADMSTMFDGNRDTRWGSGGGIQNGMFIAFEFGEAKKISQIFIDLAKSENDFPAQFEVLAGNSLDSVEAVKFDYQKKGSLVSIKINNPKSAKFYKILCTQDNPAWWWSVYEIKFEQ